MLIACAALLGLGSNAAYILKPIFTDPSQTVECFGLNDKSQVICDVTDATNRDLPERAFLWKDGKLTEIIAPKEDPDETVSVAGFSLNNDGTVIGTVYRHLPDDSRPCWEFRWNADSGIEKLMVDGHYFFPTSINNKGDITGKVADPDDPLRPWTFGVLTQKEGFIPYFPSSWEFFGGPLNDKGAIAGGSDDGKRSVPFRILPGSTQVEPLTLPAYADVTATGAVLAINKDGWMVGNVTLHPSAYLQKDRMATAALWSPDNQFYPIGDRYSVVACDMNDKGEVVGATRVMRPSHETLAFIYDTKNGVRILDNLVPPGSPHLLRADAINNKGQILCESPSGWFLLTPAGASPNLRNGGCDVVLRPVLHLSNASSDCDVAGDV